MKTTWIKSVALTGALAAAGLALSGCVVVPARPAYVAPGPAVYAHPAPVYVAPAPVVVRPRVWIGGRWVYRH
jgi:hypothetical protein